MIPYTIILPDGTPQPLRQQKPLVSVEKMEQTQSLLSEDIVTMTVKCERATPFEIRSTILAFGKTYTLNQKPKLNKISKSHFEYELKFEGSQYELRRAVMFNTDVSGFNTASDQPITGDIELFLDVIINNMNRVKPGLYSKGQFPSTQTKTIIFDEGSNCLAALQKICQEFKEEFDIQQTGPDSRVIHIRKNGEIIGAHVFGYGQGNGLYELKRNTVDTQDIITRLYVYGATKNIPLNYRNFARRLRIGDPGYLENPAAVARYGVIEGIVIYEDVFPHRTGAVTSVLSPTSFTDESMDFDLNESSGGTTTYLVADNPAKVHFNTGNLAGYEFTISKYTHSSKTFVITQVADERGLKLPNDTEIAFQIQPGDQYVIVDINLPSTYVTTAEAELNNRGVEELNNVSAPRVQYELAVDEQFLFNHYGDDAYTNVFGIGDYLQIYDADLGIDQASRITKFTRDGLRPYNYTIELNDTYKIDQMIEIIQNQNEVKTIIKLGRIDDVNRLRQAYLNALEVLRMVFDPDGYFDGGKIRPLTVETLSLAVGAKSQQFVLEDVLFQPNFEGNTNVIDVSAGYLTHYAIFDTPKTWALDATNVTIPDNQARYIYAKVEKTGDNGIIIFKSDQIMPDEDPAYYHFWVGILNTVIDGSRGVSLTYGFTTINGRFIKTGRISDLTGLTYFDLDEGVIAGLIKFRDSAGNYRDLSDIGADMEGFYKATIVNPPASYPDGKVTAYFTVINPATWPSAEDSMHEGDVWYNPNTGSVSRYIGGTWQADATPSVVKAYTSTYVRLGNNATIQVFTDQPIAPYGLNDLWMSPEGLRRSIAEKVTGQPFAINDWVEPFNFDNTETAINGGIITSGVIQLAGDNNSVLAGISGKGTSDASIRFWAGASTINMTTAPFRVDQGGRLTARTRIEVEGLDLDGETYVGQAGLAGQSTVADGPIRIYAGRPYADRNTAPFRVDYKGFAWLTRAQLGNMQIQSGGLTNQDDNGNFIGDASVILRDDTNNVFVGIGTNLAPATSGMRITARFENSEVSTDIGHVKAAAMFRASGGSDPSAMNYAIYSPSGISMLGEALINGRKSVTVNPGAGMGFDAGRYDLITLLYPAGSVPNIQLIASSEYNLVYNGKELTVISTNDVNPWRIVNTVRNQPTITLPGGSVTCFIFSDGYWYIKSFFDNNY